MAQITIELSDSQLETLTEACEREGLTVEEFLTDISWQRIKNERYYKNSSKSVECQAPIDIAGLNATIQLMNTFLQAKEKFPFSFVGGQEERTVLGQH